MSQDNRLADALAQCREQDVLALVREKLDAGVSPTDVVAECNRGMAQLGDRFASGDCFLPELMFGGKIMKDLTAELGPHLEGTPEVEKIGTAVLGSVQHDIHDIGKDIIVMLLRGVGFEVVDLGVDVPPARFVEAIREHQPHVIGMSVLLTTCYDAVKETVAAIEHAGLRDNLCVMVGGAAASDLLAEASGCDFYGKTAVDGMKRAMQTVGAEA